MTTDKKPVDKELIEAQKWHLAQWEKQEPAALKQFEEAKEQLRYIRANIAYYKKELAKQGISTEH